MSPATFILDNDQKRERCAKRVLALPLGGQIWDVTIKEWEPIRSIAQNNRLHLIFYRVAQKIGSTTEAVKLAYKEMFLPPKIYEVHGITVKVYPKTSKMGSKKLNVFMEQVEEHAISFHEIIIGENEYAYE